MSTISRKSLPLGQRPSVAALFIMAIMFSADAGAQGVKSGNTVGAPSGAVGGGTAGSTSRSGASGVSNPTPGGSPAMTGGPQSSSGPQANETSRSGYLGGRSTDVVNPPVNPPGTPTTYSSITTAQFGRCPTPGANPMTAQARLSGNNFGRIETVSRHLTSGPKPAKNSNATYLLVDLQEELQKTTPDLILAGTYLGIVSAKAMTPSLAADISESLCAPVSSSAAATIAEVAEAQRRKLAQER